MPGFLGCGISAYMWPALGTRVRRTLGVERTHQRTPDGWSAGKEHAVASAGSVAAVDLQSLGWIRRRERCRASVARSDLPAHGFGKNLGARSGADLPVAVVRDGAVDPGREPLWAGRDQPGADCTSGRDRFAAAGGRTSDAATLWEYGAADRGAVASGGIAEGAAGNRSKAHGGRG